MIRRRVYAGICRPGCLLKKAQYRLLSRLSFVNPIAFVFRGRGSRPGPSVSQPARYEPIGKDYCALYLVPLRNVADVNPFADRGMIDIAGREKNACHPDENDVPHGCIRTP